MNKELGRNPEPGTEPGTQNPEPGTVTKTSECLVVIPALHVTVPTCGIGRVQTEQVEHPGHGVIDDVVDGAGVL